MQPILAPVEAGSEPPVRNWYDRLIRWSEEAIKPGGLAGIACAFLLVLGMTLLLFGIRLVLPLPPIVLAFLVPVLIAAIRWGTLASLCAAWGGVLSAAYFFYKPYYTLNLTEKDPARVLSMVLFTIVAIVAGHLAARSRREAAIAGKRETDI